MIEDKLSNLINEYDYVYSKKTLYSKTIRGFTTAKAIGKFTTVVEAAKYLIPVINDNIYTNKVSELVGV